MTDHFFKNLQMQRPRGPRPGLPTVGSSSTAVAQTNIAQTHDKLRFGNIELLCFPNSNISFKILSHISVTKSEKCILDNLWISYNKNPKDQKYFLACLNALSEHFSQDHKKFKCYVVIKGRLPGVYHTWLEVSDCIKNFPNPLYKGFYSISEALEECRKHIGINYFVAPSLKNVSDQPLDYSSNFCQHCECMTRNFKILNESNHLLQQEKLSLQKKISDLEQEIINLKISNPDFQTVSGTIEPKKSIANPAQTVAGKDVSNPFIVMDLLKAQQTQEAVDPLTLNQTQQAENPVIENKIIEDQTQQTGSSATKLISPIDLKQKSPINFSEETLQSSQDPEQITPTDIRRLKEMFDKIEEIQQQVKQRTTKKKKVQMKKKNKGKKKVDLTKDSENNTEEDNDSANYTDGGASLDSIGRHNYETR